MDRNYNISFKSNIHIVPKQLFDQVVKGKNIDHLSDVLHIIQANQFYTLDVKTCTAGSFISKSGENPVGFHFFDTYINLNKARVLARSVLNQFDKKPNNGLILGSKKLPNTFKYREHQHSIEFFQQLKNTFFEYIDKISIFEGHQKIKSRTHYYYSKDEDTHYICAEYVNRKNEAVSVTNYNQLKKFYKKIKIAQGDHLFINNSEILIKS